MTYKPTPYYRIVAIIAAICLGLAIQSWTPTAQLPNGCVYKINPPNFSSLFHSCEGTQYAAGSMPFFTWGSK